MKPFFYILVCLSLGLAACGREGTNTPAQSGVRSILRCTNPSVSFAARLSYEVITYATGEIDTACKWYMNNGTTFVGFGHWNPSDGSSYAARTCEVNQTFVQISGTRWGVGAEEADISSSCTVSQ